MKISFLIFFSLFFSDLDSQSSYLFIGTYTQGKPDTGIFIYKFNSRAGTLESVCAGQNITNPSFLTTDPDGEFVYACTETKMKNAGSVTCFAFDAKKRRLKFINKQPSGGENPVYVSVHKSGKWLVNANYTSGSLSVFALSGNGEIKAFNTLIQYSDSSVNKNRQEKSHIHAAVFSPDGKVLFVTDLGGDKIWRYKFFPDSSHQLKSVEPAFTKAYPGSGPRHFTFHPSGKFAYSIEELSETISVFEYTNENLLQIQRVPIRDSTVRVSSASADIHVSPDGKFLYASNRGERNTIAIFSVDLSTGKLTWKGDELTLGESPRNFAIDPTGKYLLVANAGSDNIIVFKRDAETGLLTDTGTHLKIPRPSCLHMVPIPE
jgi:6-phosphogluconolactonase